VCLEKHSKISVVSAADSGYLFIETDLLASQNKSSTLYRIVSGCSANSKPEPAHAMPEYPPDWYEQAQYEYSTPARPACVAPSSAVVDRKQKQAYNRVVRSFKRNILPTCHII
jgi:hypothetical protein